MKKLVMLVTGLVGGAVLFSAGAATAAEAELRPTQKLMQARKAWRDNMEKNLAAGNLADVAKDAEALAAQTRTVAEGLANPLAKELTLRLTTLSEEVVAAAAKQDAATIKIKIGDIKGTCAECHKKIRDKK